jgi:hypothetical protein
MPPEDRDSWVEGQESRPDGGKLHDIVCCILELGDIELRY